MKTLKWMTAVAILFATSMSVNAQRGQRNNCPSCDSIRMENHLAQLTQDLALNDKQQKEFETLLVEHKKVVMEKRQSQQADREKHRAEMDAVRTNFDADVAKILSAEQKTKFDEIKKQRNNKDQNPQNCNCHHGKGHGKGNGQGNGQGRGQGN